MEICTFVISICVGSSKEMVFLLEVAVLTVFEVERTVK